MANQSAALAQAITHHEAGRWEQAEQLYRLIIAADAAAVEARHRLGLLALETGRRVEAVQQLEQAVALDDSLAKYHLDLGSAYLATARSEKAIAAFSRAAELDPTSSAAHYNLGVALTQRDRMAEAAESYYRCLAVAPNHSWSLNNLAELARLRGDLDEALKYLESALAAEPTLAAAHYNLALVWLTQGRFAEGWQEYEWRLRCDGCSPRHFAQRTWNGETLTDETLLVHAEQGFGDTVQFIRYLPLVRERCRNVVIEVPRRLLPLLTCSGIAGLVAQGDPFPRFDVQISLPSLPRIFGTTLSTIPAEIPYLSAQEELVERWRRELAAYQGFKIGVAWQGSTSFRGDRFRSLPLAQFAPLALLPGVCLFSLQKGPGCEQISSVRGTFPIVDLGSRIDEASGAFMDTAAIMQNLDLVISSDTVTAHLVGALGVDVWLALAAGCDWRWLVDRGDSPWYPTMRLFRQQNAGDWQGVFAAMADELDRVSRTA